MLACVRAEPAAALRARLQPCTPLRRVHSANAWPPPRRSGTHGCRRVDMRAHQAAPSTAAVHKSTTAASRAAPRPAHLSSRTVRPPQAGPARSARDTGPGPDPAAGNATAPCMSRRAPLRLRPGPPPRAAAGAAHRGLKTERVQGVIVCACACAWSASASSAAVRCSAPAGQRCARRGPASQRLLDKMPYQTREPKGALQARTCVKDRGDQQGGSDCHA